MKYLFLGDSITEGVGASSQDKRYTDLVGKRLGCETVNYGISGTRIARQMITSERAAWDVDFRLRVPLMTKDCDKVFVFGGTNDFGHGACHLGSPECENEKTFATQLKLLIRDLTEKYGREKLCFIIPLRRFSEDPIACKGDNRDELGAPFSEYVDVMRAIISAHGIDYIDLYENGFPKPTVNTGDEYTTDGLHPNDRGYELIADRICEYLTR